MFTWDKDYLQLLGVVDPPGANYLSSSFPSDPGGVNEADPPQDGNGFYVVLPNLGNSLEAAPPPGTLITTFQFEALAATPAANVQIVPNIGVTDTVVVAVDPPGADITGTLGSATVEVLGDSDGDGWIDSVDNCPAVFNPWQANTDGADGGDLCDPCPTLVVDNCDAAGSTAVEVEAAVGATIVTPDAGLTLEIPAGSLTTDTTISVTKDPFAYGPGIFDVIMPDGSTASGLVWYDLGPDGTTFNPPATLTVVTGETALPPGLIGPSLDLYRQNPGTGYYEALGATCSVNEISSGLFIATCVVEISGFSTYAMIMVGEPIPTVSQWGVAVMALLLLSCGTLVARAVRGSRVDRSVG